MRSQGPQRRLGRLQQDNIVYPALTGLRPPNEIDPNRLTR